jgi:HPt (histidine-containing phosphotransfer) domain-containing protein
VTEALDRSRLAELAGVFGGELPRMLDFVLQSMTGSLARLEQALVEARLDAAIQAAHGCRNDALVVGARRLQRALEALETAARESHLEQAREALARVRAAWPDARRELERALADLEAS